MYSIFQVWAHNIFLNFKEKKSNIMKGLYQYFYLQIYIQYKLNYKSVANINATKIIGILTQWMNISQLFWSQRIWEVMDNPLLGAIKKWHFQITHIPLLVIFLAPYQ